MAEFPKLTKAQQEAWARILEWYAQEDRDNSFAPLFYAPRHAAKNWRVQGKRATFDALVKKGLLVVAYAWGNAERYAIHPDYLPASKPAAEPVSEPVAVDDEPLSEGLTNAIRAIWERNFEMVDMGEAALAAGMIERERAKFGNHPTFETIGNEVRANWKARNLESASEPATDDAPRFKVGDKVALNGSLREIAGVYGNAGKWAYTLSHANSVEGIIQFKEAALEPAPADDARPTTDEARLLDSVNEARMERDRARNEVDSLRGQLDALRVRVAEMEAELAGEAADLEATAVREAHLATRVDELEAENAGLYEQVEKLNDEAENMSAYIVRVEQARDFWKRKSNPTYDSLKAVSDKQDEVIAALETALDLEKNENEKLRAAVERIERKSRMAWNIYSLTYTEDSDYGDFLEIRNIAAEALGIES